MAFFTRKAFTVPDLPHEGILTEEPEEPQGSQQSSISSQYRQLNRISISQHSGDRSGDEHNIEPATSKTATTTAAIATNITTNSVGVSSSETTTKKVAQNDLNNVEKFDYVIDRTYGVEV